MKARHMTTLRHAQGATTHNPNTFDRAALLQDYGSALREGWPAHFPECHRIDARERPAAFRG
jgi:hypothetical protein